MESLDSQGIYIPIMLTDSEYKPEKKTNSAKPQRELKFKKQVLVWASSLPILYVWVKFLEPALWYQITQTLGGT